MPNASKTSTNLIPPIAPSAPPQDINYLTNLISPTSQSPPSQEINDLINLIPPTSPTTPSQEIDYLIPPTSRSAPSQEIDYLINQTTPTSPRAPQQEINYLTVLQDYNLRRPSKLCNELPNKNLTAQAEQNIEHIKSATPDLHVKLLIYYKNKKLKNLLISNNNHKYEEHNVMYRFTCEREPCNQAQFYIGYTTTTVKLRMTAHAQQGSIKKHLMEVHHQNKVTTQEIMKNITILRQIANPNDI